VNRSIVLLAGVLLCLAACAAPAGSASTSGAAPSATAELGLVDIGAGLTGKAGLSASMYGSGKIADAAVFAIDGQGRLWVGTGASTDTGTDGVYLVASGTAVPFEVISGLHTVLGLAWDDGELYVASSEGVTAWSGLSGQNFAAHRTVLSLPSGVGEVNGLALGPDGRFYLGVSSPCDHCTPTSAQSAAVLSFLPDGSDQRVLASGIRAPVGLAFYPGTSDLFVTMNQRDDLGDATPGDWLSVVKQGQDWGFPACYGQGGSACTNTPNPVAVLDKHAAVSSVAIVTGQLGSSLGPGAVVAEWSVGRVVWVALSQSHGTYSGTTSTLVSGITNPVAVVLAPDESLFVSDWKTGTIYRITSG
jgi:glucose/arabinose dehydrogenase